MNHQIIALLATRPAGDADIPFLLALRHESMDPHLIAAGIALSAEQHRERVRDRLDSAEILLMKDMPVGMIKVAREPGYWHIMQLQVIPAMRGRGVGNAILQRVIADAVAATAQLTLGVLKMNPAKRLYERLGFIVRGESQREFDMIWRGTNAALLVELRMRERELHAACVANDAARAAQYIHADFREFGRSGKIWDRPSLLQALRESSPLPSPTFYAPHFHSQDFAIHSRTPESCLLTFRSADVMPDGGLERHSLRSSTWVSVNCTWQLIFHQGTATPAFNGESAA